MHFVFQRQSAIGYRLLPFLTLGVGGRFDRLLGVVAHLRLKAVFKERNTFVSCHHSGWWVGALAQ